jgi:CRP-like cAMP-binding protein
MITKKLNLIRGMELFENLSPEEHEFIAAGSLLETYGHGQPIVREGGDGGALFMIVMGSVDVSTSALSRHVKLQTLESGSYFGEVSILSGKATTASVIACNPCEILRIPGSTLQEILAQNQELRAKLEGVTLARAKDTIEKVLK